jgi:asparagine synthase (glutamine-hydrolysing)
MPLNESLITLRRSMSEHQLNQFAQPEILKSFSSSHLLRYVERLGTNEADQILQITKYECNHYLLNTLLRDADAVSMGHGLEVRPIFLDHHLVEHALALPAASKWKNGVSKAILKDATLDLLPPGFFNRKKSGFTLPTNYWLEHELKDRLETAMEYEVTAQLFKTKFIDKVKGQLLKNNFKKIVFQMLILMSWLQRERISAS